VNSRGTNLYLKFAKKYYQAHGQAPVSRPLMLRLTQVGKYGISLMEVAFVPMMQLDRGVALLQEIAAKGKFWLLKSQSGNFLLLTYRTGSVEATGNFRCL